MIARTLLRNYNLTRREVWYEMSMPEIYLMLWKLDSDGVSDEVDASSREFMKVVTEVQAEHAAAYRERMRKAVTSGE